MRLFTPVMMVFFCLLGTQAAAGMYHLDISQKKVNVTGKSAEKITVNGTIPGPALHFTEGEEVTITVTNHLKTDTSVHWHGLLLPGDMDGVPGLNGFPGIAPGETFTYRFPVRQAGTYWYHAHSTGQEQDGLYGSIVITPKGGERLKADRDYVVLLSDYTDENSDEILAHLKMDSAYYNRGQRTVGDFMDDARKIGMGAAWKDASDWGKMRMSPTDLADVSGYTFLINGQTPEQNWTGLFTPGETVRLRFINASAMSFYDVRIPGVKMQLVAADGQNVESVPVDEFRFGVAETYDVLVRPDAAKAYTIVAEPIDRSGFAIGTLAPREGMRGEMPVHRKRGMLTMFDMNMQNMMQEMPDMDMSSPSAEVSGWADAGTPPGDKALSYSDLRYAGIQPQSAPPKWEIVVRLGGNMERYIWTLNGQKYSDASPINLKYGERVRLKFINDSMMAHPMHLHGMFVQLENGQPGDKLPNKHTVIVPPGQSYSVLLTANEPGEWAFHCHLLFHMMSGMMNKVVVARLNEGEIPQDYAPEEPGASHAK